MVVVGCRWLFMVFLLVVIGCCWLSSVVVVHRLISLAVVVYVYLFRKYRKSRLRHVGNKSANRKESMYQTFRNSRFYLDFLLVISFVIFMVIPNTISLFHGWAGRQRTHEAKDANKVSYQLLFLINFILCIAMHADVRRFVSKLYTLFFL